MPITHFEKLVERAQLECLTTALTMSVGDSHEVAFVHRHGMVKGIHEGLQKALELYRQSAREDSEDVNS